MIRLKSFVIRSGFRMPGDNHTTQTVETGPDTAIAYDPETALVLVGQRGVVRAVHVSRADELVPDEPMTKATLAAMGAAPAKVARAAT